MNIKALQEIQQEQLVTGKENLQICESAFKSILEFHINMCIIIIHCWTTDICADEAGGMQVSKSFLSKLKYSFHINVLLPGFY